MRERDEDEFFYQSPFQRVSSSIDELSSVVKGYKLNSLRKSCLQFRDLRLYPLDNIQRVHPVAGNDHAPDSFLTVFIEHSGAKRASQMHVGDVSDVDRRAIGRTDDGVLNIRGRVDEA